MVNNNERLWKLQKIFSNLGLIIVLIFMIPMLIIGIIYFTVGLSSNINERNKIKDYNHVTATLKEYIDCTYKEGYSDEFCKAVYEYQANDTTYTITSTFDSTKEGFKETKTVYYNPNNPSESLMLGSWTSRIVGGAIIIAVSLFTIIYNIVKHKKNK